MPQFSFDTNCWIQIARDRVHAGEVTELLKLAPLRGIYISIYSVHSIGNILTKQGWGGYARLLKALSIGNDVRVISIPIVSLSRVEDASEKYELDFDDAYQYVAAELNGLRLVSLDADFDRTPNGRLTPAAAVQLFKDEPKT